ncbi:MAG TPA: EAL domain-containing protein [Candidatus Limnocylindrales bacterium]
MTRATDEQELLDAMCRIAVGMAGYPLAWVGFAENDEGKTVRPVARYGEAARYLDEVSITWGKNPLSSGPTGTAIRTGKVRMARDLTVEPGYGPWRATAAEYSLASSISLPLLKDGVAFGAFIVYAPEVDAFGDAETEILKELADDLAFGIRTLRERSERDRLAGAIEQVTDSVIVTDRDGRITYVNPAFERVTGYSRDEVMGQNPRFLKSGLHTAWFYDAMWAAISAGVPWSADVVNRRKDGTLFTEETVVSPIFDASGEITSYVAVKRDVTQERALVEHSTQLARQRLLIAETIRGLRAGDTPEATAQAICHSVLSLPGILAAQLALFELDAHAWPIGFAVDGQQDPELRRLPAQRSLHLLERATEGPWIEPWLNRPRHPYNQLLNSLGVHEIAHAPVRYEQRLIGTLFICAGESRENAILAESMPALVEFADLAGALIGREASMRTEAKQGRAHISRIIDSRMFHPVFQPIVDLDCNRIVGYEALTRFSDGTNPELLFAEATAVGLGVELETATLEAAIAASSRLPESAWLNLNASPELIISGKSLRALLLRSNKRVVLEVTEHTAITDYKAFRAVIASLGPKVELAVDDAGVGFSSLRHVLELRPAFVKLDRWLVADLETDRARQAMIAGLRHFARATGCQLIAEGVETDRELAVLQGLEIRLGQGYLLGRPLPVAAYASAT